MRALQRTVALCLVVIVSALLFYFGREHRIFLDNKTIDDVEGNSYRALKFVRVSVNDSSQIELLPRDRDLVKVAGPSFRFKVEVMDDFGEEVEKVIEREFRLGFDKDVMFSLPLLASDRDDYVLPPPTIQTPSSEQETPDAAGEEGFIPGAGE